MPTPVSSAVSHLRIRLDRISPLIWHRLLVRDTPTIGEMHAIIQIAFGWSDDHLHQCVIHGKHDGIAYLGGPSFADNPAQVHLADFHFRTSDRFFSEYNFHVPWCYEVRVEQILSSAPDQRSPVCIGGVRAAPPEECADPYGFLEERQLSPAPCNRTPPRLHGRPRRASRPVRRATDPLVLEHW